MPVLTETCFMCGASATSREHAPPACIFPKPDDVDDGTDRLRNLIAVPACDAHNSAKSKDDEDLRMVLLHGYFNNGTGKHLSITKLMRAAERRPPLLSALHSENTPVVVDGAPTSAVTVDRPRFDKSLEAVVRAI